VLACPTFNVGIALLFHSHGAEKNAGAADT
jgi:hypothetical protein